MCNKRCLCSAARAAFPFEGPETSHWRESDPFAILVGDVGDALADVKIPTELNERFNTDEEMGRVGAITSVDRDGNVVLFVIDYPEIEAPPPEALQGSLSRRPDRARRALVVDKKVSVAADTCRATRIDDDGVAERRVFCTGEDDIRAFAGDLNLKRVRRTDVNRGHAP